MPDQKSFIGNKCLGFNIVHTVALYAYRFVATYIHMYVCNNGTHVEQNLL